MEYSILQIFDINYLLNNTLQQLYITEDNVWTGTRMTNDLESYFQHLIHEFESKTDEDAVLIYKIFY